MYESRVVLDIRTKLKLYKLYEQVSHRLATIFKMKMLLLYKYLDEWR